MTSPIVMQRNITNTYNETRLDAQYIGDLNNLNAFDIALTGTLVPRDKGDYYSFRVTTGNTYVLMTTLNQATAGSSGSSTTSNSTSGSSSSKSKTPDPSTLVTDGQLRYQVLSQTGQVIADSNAGSGQAYTAFQALTSGKNLSLNEGTYTVKVSPGPNATPNTTYDYIFTLRAGQDPVSPSSPVNDNEEFQTTAAAATTNTNEAISGWLPTILSPASTATSMFETLDAYDGGGFAAGQQSTSSSSASVPLESDTLLGGVVNLSG